MKVKTSIINALKIAERIRSANGLIGTPGTQYECFRIKRAWVFGSTIKGKENPNDTDVILDAVECGRIFTANKPRRNDSKFEHCHGARIDREYLRRFGIYMPLSCQYTAHKYLRGGLKMVRLHDWNVDHKAAEQRVMIYPKNDLTSYAKERNLI